MWSLFTVFLKSTAVSVSSFIDEMIVSLAAENRRVSRYGTDESHFEVIYPMSDRAGQRAARRKMLHSSDGKEMCNYIEDIQVFGVNMSFISLSEVKKFYIS